jgi:hypothetical protein
MEILNELLTEMVAADDHLTDIYRSLPDVTLAEEAGRLRERFLDIGSKIVAISEIRSAA